MNSYSIQHTHYKSCSSTQVLLQQQLENHKEIAQNILISSEHQTNGIGQRNAQGNNQWHSTHQSLAMSFTIDSHSVLTLTSAKIAVMAMNFLNDKNLGVKWPNDLYRKDTFEKVGGILIQTVQNRCLVGIGLNLCASVEDKEMIPEDLKSKVGYLDRAVENIESFVNNFYLYLLMHEKELVTYQIIQKWNEHCVHKNLKTQNENGEYIGEFCGIGDIGQGLLRQNGIVSEWVSGRMFPLFFS